MKQIQKEDIVKLYILLKNIRHCAYMEGWLEGLDKKGMCDKIANYQDVRIKYTNKFNEIIFDTYGSRDDFIEDLQSWREELDPIEIGPI